MQGLICSIIAVRICPNREFALYIVVKCLVKLETKLINLLNSSI